MPIFIGGDKKEPSHIYTYTERGIEVWYNPTLGLLSITTDDGASWTTIADRDLGASSLGQSGQLFQWGNNYGFLYLGTITTQSTTLDVTTYGPDNPYSNSTFDRNTSSSASSYSYTSASGINGYGYNLWGFYSSDIADKRGPCDAGSHIPTQTEVTRLINCLSVLGYTTADQVEEVIYLPCAGSLAYEDGQPSNQGYTMRYRTCEPSNIYQAKIMYGGRQTGTLSPLGTSIGNKGSGFSIRPFYDEGLEPEGLGWSQIGASRNYQLRYNSMAESFTFTIDGGATWNSFWDRNLGATQRFTPGLGAVYSEETCGKYYQWGNNYGFSYNGASKTSSGQVSPCNYGPGNYYSSDTFITVASSISNSQCWLAPNPIQNLWGGVTGTNEAKQGPCPTGFHVPTREEMASIQSVRNYISLTVPYYYRNYNSTGSSITMGSYNNSAAYRWTCETSSTSLAYGYRFYNTGLSGTRSMAYGYPIRPFKDVPVTPTEEDGWTRIHKPIVQHEITGVYRGSTKIRPTWRPDSSRTIFYYEFNNNLTDSSGNSHTPTASDGIGYAEVGEQYVATNTSTTPYIQLDPTIGDNLTDFTISFFIKPTIGSGQGDVMLFGFFDTASPYAGPSIFYCSDGRILARMTGNNNQYPCSLTQNTWQYITFTRIDGECKFYRNGVLQLTWTDATTYTPVEAYIFSRNLATQQFKGTAMCDKFILENVGWDASSIKLYYNQNKRIYS